MESITVLFFATLRDRVGFKSITLEIPSDTTVAALRKMLKEKYVVLNGLIDHSLVSVNREYVFDENLVPADAEVAFFPAVSGG